MFFIGGCCYYYYTHPTGAEGTGKVESIYGCGIRCSLTYL